jgi:hypothetical protein
MPREDPRLYATRQWLAKAEEDLTIARDVCEQVLSRLSAEVHP